MQNNSLTKLNAYLFSHESWLNQLMLRLAATPCTVVAGLMLLLSFLRSKELLNLPIDPAWITIILSGLPLVHSACQRLALGKGISKISSALLITIAMLAAIAIGDLFAAGEVAFIMAIGAILENMTAKRAQKGLGKLLELAPSTAIRLLNYGQANQTSEQIDTAKLQLGDIVRILPGETIPVDGEVISGTTSVNQAVLTGESLPVDKQIGDRVFAGTLNTVGSIDVKTTHIGENSSLQKLIRLVQEADKKQAHMQRLADRWASFLVPASLTLAILVYLFTQSLTKSVTILVVFCPCALVLATPTAIMAAIAQASKHGVIIKSGVALETMGKIDLICFDKTGTLTSGKLVVSDIICLKQQSADELLQLVASLESKSEHPLAKAIVNLAQSKQLVLSNTSSFTLHPGQGLSATLNKQQYWCGNLHLLEQNSIKLSDKAKQQADLLTKQGKAILYLATNAECIGIIALADSIRPETKSVISKLKALSTDAVLLTGDNPNTASCLAKEVGIDHYYANLLPEDKVSYLHNIKQDQTVCMIGDGINDAPALKTADVSIAMGKMGSDIAIDSADIALMSDDLSRLPYLKRLANATRKTIKFSISLSMLINFLAIILSIAGLLDPTSGALVHNAGSCFVVLISALLYDRKFI